MAIGFTKIRYGHAVAAQHARNKRDAACESGGLYKTPTSGQVVSSDSTLEISWDTSCLDSTAVDIYLYAPYTVDPRIHEWQNVDYSYGSYNTTLDPSWWNSTSVVSLQMMIVDAGTPTFLATYSAGPLFNATYSNSNSGKVTTSTTGSVTDVDNLPGANKHGLSGGDAAAAVIMTLLAVCAIAVGFYIKRSRARSKGKRQRFSVAVDQRMSTISTDWKSVTTAGAAAAIRNSMMVSDSEAGKRSSSFSFGAIRPSSTIGLEGGQAGVGTMGLQMSEKMSLDLSTPPVPQARPRARASTFTAADRASRVSRVSFAPDARPVSEYRRTRAFHTGHLPPIPDTNVREAGELSPTQAEGPMDLTAEDIRQRMAGHDGAGRSSLDAMMPALSMMRTGGDSPTTANEDLFAAASLSRSPPVLPSMLPTPPLPVLQTTESPVMHTMSMTTIPATMSPDDMLRAYAERTLRSPPPITPPAASYNGGGMRTLYASVAPDAPPPAALAPPSPASLYPSSPQHGDGIYRQSFAPTEDSRYGEENVEHGTAE
ncbi:hypothetical protein IEO21_07897 [Rhodonia placenta]|uniref:Uncharacterized protein n=1 Tax=Rhodonia placenta TaxID=104341 RepID=A0A8H7NXM7_9APHY|nr:hypothetical protein IEO21_07897 [Postia placenta]